MAGRLQDKVVVITGSGSGIGKELAIAMAKEGASIVNCARRLDKVQETAAEIEALGQRSIAVKCDIASPEDCENAAAAAIAEFGRIDVLVNNAAIFRTSTFMDESLEVWNKTLAVNLTGTWLMSKACLKYMLEAGKGNIVMVNSSHCRTCAPMLPSYAISKAGMLQLTRAIAGELGPQGIRCNGFHVGYTPGTEGTERELPDFLGEEFQEAFAAGIPLRRNGRADDYNGICIYLASDESSFMTGQTVAVSGGDCWV